MSNVCCGNPATCKRLCAERMRYLETRVESGQLTATCLMVTQGNPKDRPSKCGQAAFESVSGKSFCRTHARVARNNMALFAEMIAFSSEQSSPETGAKP